MYKQQYHVQKAIATTMPHDPGPKIDEDEGIGNKKRKVARIRLRRDYMSEMAIRYSLPLTGEVDGQKES